MQQNTVTLIVAGLGIGGTLCGIIVGHVLTRSWQQKQWLMDQRKDEFREVITALHDSMVSEATRGRDSFEITSEERRDKALKTSDFYRTLGTRVFTAKDVWDLGLEERWRKILDEFREKDDGFVLSEEYERLLVELVTIATNPPSKLKF